ncbi:MAG: MBL fold metallo-hydrolase [Candidatus Campbellbacteria bacterium]|nr:MBL fold metallo-hydrolase [Candidatus Campbellbacteria bacterium]
MIITYNTLESFKVQFGDAVLAFNPVSKKSKHTATSYGADVVLVSVNHPDMNGAETVARGDASPLVISGPGEYELNGIVIRGYSSKSMYDGKERLNTVYLVTLEDMKMCFCGALSDGQLSSELYEVLDDVDILFLPIGGDGVLDARAAHKLSVSLEPHVVIPMHYTADTLKAFLKEEGETGASATDKVTLRKKEVIEKEGEVIVLSPQV